MMLPKDRREHQRLEVELPVRIERAGRGARATALNIGEQGLRLSVRRSFPVKRGDEILVELRLRDGAAPVKALGWVTAVQHSVESNAVSLTFFGLPEADAVRIRAFVTAGLSA